MSLSRLLPLVIVLGTCPVSAAQIVLPPSPASRGGTTSAGATLFEDFEGVEVRALPEGWGWFQEGGTIPEAHWGVFDDFGRRIAYSSAEPGGGAVDRDGLVTPPFAPVTGDHLVFDATQGLFEDVGDQFFVLVSPAGADAPGAFTDTLAAYDEAAFPLGWQTLRLDLGTYVGRTVRVAFVHESTAADPDEWRLDNVWVRPLQAAAVIDAGLVFQNRSPFGQPLPVAGSAERYVVTANVRVVGDGGAVEATAFSFTTEGTTDPAHVVRAELYTTGAEPILDVGDPTTSTRFGAVDAPGASFTVEGSQTLALGDNYVWLVYTVDPALRPAWPYPQADATFVGAVIDGSTVAASVATLDGSLDIVEAPAPNDSLAHAAEIAPGGGRYGSNTLFAGDELDRGEPGASCVDGGTFDGRNSVWWRYTAPSAGALTVDLAASEFNTVLTVLDEGLSELACNDDAVPFEVPQSRVAGVTLAAGQTVYVRVTGWGLPTLGEEGVVVLDASFEGAVAGEGGPADGRPGLSRPRPNPAVGRVAFDVVAPASGAVEVDVVDALGRRVRAGAHVAVVAGEPSEVVVDVTGLSSGRYVVRARGAGLADSRPFTVAR